uniref:Interleukin enhancer-binding factor 2 homolog n=1 Tax=Cacopsylla melanoneura TaxID=428564 RepID=A0A8D8RHI2_9HEMI
MVRGGIRGSSRGRGGLMRGGIPPSVRRFPKYVPHMRHPFDYVLCENIFPRVNPRPDEESYEQILLKRNEELTPSEQDLTLIQGFVQKVQAVFDKLIIASGDAEIDIDETRAVGSFKKGVAIKGEKSADLVIIFKSLPTKEAINWVATKVLTEIKAGEAPRNKAGFKMEAKEHGFNLINKGLILRCLVTTVHSNLKQLTPEVHVPLAVCKLHLLAYKHVHWFDVNAQNDVVKALVRIMRDLKTRFEGFAALNPWMIELLVHSSVIQPPRKPLTIGVGFRRIIELLASGIFITGSSSITDPCDVNSARVHAALDQEKQDLVCFTAQTLIRILAHGGLETVLRGSSNLTQDTTVWNGVVVIPLEKVYEKPAEKTSESSDSMETDEAAAAAMET